jgi:hypothetical protein
MYLNLNKNNSSKKNFAKVKKTVADLRGQSSLVNNLSNIDSIPYKFDGCLSELHYIEQFYLALFSLSRSPVTISTMNIWLVRKKWENKLLPCGIGHMVT